MDTMSQNIAASNVAYARVCVCVCVHMSTCVYSVLASACVCNDLRPLGLSFGTQLGYC